LRRKPKKADAEAKKIDAEKKMIWSDRIKMVLKDAKEKYNYSFVQAEDYAYRETLEKKLVPDNQIPEAVQMIQRERHNAEISELLNKSFSERRTVLESAMKEVMAEKAQSRLNIMEKFSKDEGRLAQELKRLEDDYSNKPLETEKRVLNDLEPEHTRLHMELKHQQLEEIAKIVNMYSGGRSIARLNSAGKTQEEELREYQNRLTAERNAREQELNSQRLEAEARLRAENDAALEKLQKELARKKQEADDQARREHEDLEKQKNENLEAANKEEKAKILLNFDQKNQDNLKRMEEDRLKKKAKMEERLKRKTQLTAAAAPSSDPSPELINASAAVTFGTEAQNAAQIAAIQAGRSARTPASQQQMMMMQQMPNNLDLILPQVTSQMQTIDEKLRRIEMLITASEAKMAAAAVAPQSAVPAATTTTAGTVPLPANLYHDPDPPKVSDHREPISDQDLSSPEMARIDFGRRLVTLVLGQKSSVRVSAAAHLPPSTAVNNAFSNSYDYQKGTGELLIHKEKLKSSGDFGLVVIHALSHIKVDPDNLSNDMDPKFLEEFYKNLKILSQDLYKQQAKTAAQTQQMQQGGGGSTTMVASNSRAALQTIGMNAKGAFAKSKQSPMNKSFRGSMAGVELSNAISAAVISSGDEEGDAPSLHRIGSQQNVNHGGGGAPAISIEERMKQYLAASTIPPEFFDRYGGAGGEIHRRKSVDQRQQVNYNTSIRKEEVLYMLRIQHNRSIYLHWLNIYIIYKN